MSFFYGHSLFSLADKFLDIFIYITKIYLKNTKEVIMDLLED